MNDNFEINIRKVNESSSFKDKGGQQQQGHEQKKKGKDAKSVKDYLQELAASAANANTELEKKKSPFRFRVYQEYGEVFIDIVILDNNGNIGSTIRKNITHEEFTHIVKNIERLDGIIVDDTA